jgi:hypothetical protein
MLNNPTTSNLSEIECNEQKKLAIELWDKHFPAVHKVMTELGLRREKWYEWLRDDSDFKRSTDAIREKALEEIENNLFGEGRTNKKAIVPMLFILKTWKRELYGDKLETYNTNSNIDLTEQANQTLAKARKALLKAEELVPSTKVDE